MTISNDLFLAILAMDSYNRGYGVGIDGLSADAGTRIGNAAILRDANDQEGTAQSAGFYAIAYQLADGSTVISYRGTDNPTLALGEASDIYNGWSIGAGFIGASQARLALDFYQAVSGSSVFDTPLPSNVILTGHSLGGGLAGFVSALSGARGLGFDYMPIGIATWLEAAHEAYRRTGTVPLSPADILAAGVGLPSSFAFGAINTDGEVLQYLRGGQLQELLGALGALGATILPGPLSFLSWAAGLVVGGLTATLDAGVQKTTLDNFGYSGPLKAVDLHSQALLVLLQYAKDNALTDWRSVGPEVIGATFDDSIGKALGLQKDVNGAYGPSDKLRAMIAYSAIDSGERPFGDAGIRAMFGDANDLGALVQRANVSTSILDARKALSQVLVEYAGFLASDKQMIGNKPGGVLSIENPDYLDVDLRKATWTTAQSATVNKIIGRDTLLNEVIAAGGDAGLLRLGMDRIWNDGAGARIQSLKFATSNDGLSVVLQTSNAPGSEDAVTAFIAGGGNDVVTGDGHDDLIVGGGGNDQLSGGGGKDILSGGEGNDKLSGGEGDDVLLGGVGDDEFDGGLGDDLFIGGAGRDVATYAATSGEGVVISDIRASLVPGLSNPGGAPRQVQMNVSGFGTDTLVDVERVRLTSAADKVTLTAIPTIALTIDAGTQPVGRGDILDASGLAGGAPVEYDLLNGSRLATIDGLVVDSNRLAAGGVASGVTFENFEILKGSAHNDLVVDSSGFKNVLLGEGDDVVGNLTGGVLPGQESVSRNKWVSVDMGLGSDIVTGGLQPGSEVNLGSDRDKDVVLNVMNDVLINQAGTEDRFYAANGFLPLLGGGRNVSSESRWNTEYGGLVRYGLDPSNELQIQVLGHTTMYVSNFHSELSASKSTAGILLYDFETWGGLLIDPNKPKGLSLMGTWELIFGYMWKTTFGYSAWKGVDPLVLDLNGDGISTFRTPNVGAYGDGYGMRFDLRGNGFVNPTGWIDGRDGFVVRDLNGNGKIDSVDELLGSGVSSGLQTLAAYDDNHDGIVDTGDWTDLDGDGVRDIGEGALDVLRIWKDVNGNGVTDPDELMTFTEAGVAAISVASARLDHVFDAGNQVVDQGSFTRTDGTTGLARDLSFAIDTWNSQWRPEAFGGAPIIDARIAAEPQLKGHGVLMNLQEAMALDETYSTAEQAAALQADGETITRRETLADVVDRVGPTLNTPLLSDLRKNAAPIFEAWARTAAHRQPLSTTAGQGGENVLVFVVHHADGPDEPIDYAYRRTETVTSPDGTTQELTYWVLASGAPVRDANNQSVQRPSFAQLIAYSPRIGGVWQYDDGQHRDIAPPSLQTETRLFVASDANGRQTIVDYAYLATDPTNGGTYWKLASGAAITDVNGVALDRPSYDSLLAYQPQQGGSWKTFGVPGQRFTPEGIAPNGLALLVSHASNGSTQVLDYAYETSATIVVDNKELTLFFWKLGSGQAVTDSANNVIAHPTLAQIEQYAGGSSNTVWEPLSAPTPERSTSLAHQGLNLFVTVGADGAETVIDYAYAVSETVWDPAAGDYRQITYWQLGSGSPVRDAQGQAIDRPTYDQIVSYAPTSGGVWKHFDGAAPDFSVAPHQQNFYVLVRLETDGSKTIVDYAYQTTQTIAVAGPTGLSTQDVTFWQLASGNIATDASGNLIERPTLAQLQQYAASEAGQWIEISGNYPGLSMPSHHQGVTLLRQHVDGQQDKVLDYAYQVTENVWIQPDPNMPARQATITYWKLGSGNAVTDAAGDVIAFPTLDDIEHASSALGNAYWEHFDGAYLDFLEAYSGTPIALDQPGVVTNTSFGDYINALDLILQRLDLVSVRLAIQTGLKPFFEGVEYDPATDSFKPTTNRQLSPTFEKILQSTTAMDAATETAYLSRWKRVLDIVVGDYTRGTGGQNTYGFLFSNIATAYENVGQGNALSLVQIAVTLGIPDGLVLSGSGDLTGTENPNIFYLNDSDQLATGAGGLDNYVVGGAAQHVTILDDEPAFTGQSEDVLRLTQYTPSDLSFTREGTDLVAHVNGADKTIRIVDEFHGAQPGWFGGNLTDDMGVATIVFSDGTVWDSMDMARAVRHVTPVDGIVNGTNANDVLDGGPGSNYTVSGGNASDVYVYGRGYGNVTIDDNTSYILGRGYNFVEFGEGISLSDLSFERNGTSKDLTIHIAGETSTLTIKNQFDLWSGLIFIPDTWMNRVDVFQFADGKSLNGDELMRKILQDQAASGAASIYGFSGDDVIDPGVGNKYITGGDGSDTYIYNLGYGHDVIDVNRDNLLANGDDTLRFGAGITLQNIQFSRPDGTDDLNIAMPDGGNVVVRSFYDAFDTGVFGVVFYHLIRHFVFADGTQLSAGQVMDLVFAQQEAQANVTILGQPRFTVFDAPHGNVVMKGDSFGNIYKFGRGYGADTIIQGALGHAGNDAPNSVEFGVGIAASDLVFTRGAGQNDLVISIKDTQDRLTVVDALPSYIGGRPVPTFTFQDGSSLSIDEIAQKLLLGETEAGRAIIRGFTSDDTFVAGESDRILAGELGNDTYVFSTASGNDIVADGGGWRSLHDIMQFSDVASTDVAFYRDSSGQSLVIEILPTGRTVTVDGQYGFAATNAIEEFRFSDGVVLTALDVEQKILSAAANSPDNSITGFGDSTVIETGSGNKYLTSGGGATTYHYTASGGNDVIDDRTGASTLILEDFVPSDVTIAKLPLLDDFVLRLANGRQLVLKGQGAGAGIGEIHFGDSSVWTAEEISQAVDTNSIAQILGTSGDDTLVSGTDDAVLEGGSGNDSYVYSSASGNAVIIGAGNYYSLYTRKLVFTDLTSADVQIRVSGRDLIFDILSTGKTVTLWNQYDAFGHNGIGTVTFADGESWSWADIGARLDAQQTLSGTRNIFGLAGDDRLEAGTGNKILSGGSGQDVYVYSRAGGNDVIDAAGAKYSFTSRELDFSDISSSEVAISRLDDSTDLIIKIISTGKELLVKGQFNYWGTGVIETFRFADGVTWDAAHVAKVLVDQESAVAGANVYGYYGDDTISAGTGDRTLFGSGGNDLFYYERDGGNVRIAGDSNRSTVSMRDITSSEIRFSRDGSSSDLRVTVLSTGKTVVVSNYFRTPDTFTFEFADHARYGATEIAALASQTILGTSGDDVISATAGDDVLRGLGGSDTYRYWTFDGNLTIDNTPSVASGTLAFEDINPSDIALERADGTNDLIIRVISTGKAILVKSQFDPWEWGALQTIRFADGTIWSGNSINDRADKTIRAGDAPASLQGGLGNDILIGGGADDAITAGAGRDVLYGAAGNNILTAGSGPDLFVVGPGATNKLIGFRPGVDRIKIDPAVFVDFQDFLQAATSEADDLIAIGHDGSVVTLVGVVLGQLSASDFRFAATSTSDGQLNLADGPAPGNDGSGRYYYESPAAAVSVSIDPSDGVTELVLSDVRSTQVVLDRVDDSPNLVIKVPTAGKTITLIGEFGASAAVQSVVFADGVALGIPDLEARLLVRQQSSQYGTVYGFNGDDSLSSGDGHRALIGGDGNDVYSYSVASGDVVIDDRGSVGTNSLRILDLSANQVSASHSADRSDVLITADGSGSQLTLTGALDAPNSATISSMTFADQTAWSLDSALKALIAEKEKVYFASADDESIVAGSQAAVGFAYSERSGNLTIKAHAGQWDPIKANTLRFVDLNPTDLTFSHLDHDLIATVNATGKRITVPDNFRSVDRDGVQQIQFADGTVWDFYQLLVMSGYRTAFVPTAGNDVYYGDEFIDVLDGGSGDDALYGGGADDRLTGGNGNDTLEGDGGNDVLIGGAGDDTLYGNAGDDTYVINLGDGQDTISDLWSYANGWGGNDTIQFGPGIVATDLIVTAVNDGNDLMLSIAGTTDRITILGDITGGSDHRIEQVRCDDGSVLTHAQLMALATASTPGDDVIYGDENANSVSGGAGNDTLYGRGGNDILNGGAGNDSLYGNAGDDTYVFNLGDGQDTVSDLWSYSNGWGGNDTIQFGPGIVASDLIVTAVNDGNDLTLSIAGTTDRITILGDITGGSDHRIEQVRFDDGSVLTHAQLMALATASTSGDDVIYGDENANSISGGAGNDTLYGRGGNDVLSGGAGNDMLCGNGGDDTYVFNLGDGQDTVSDLWSFSNGWGGNDTIQFGPGIAASDLVVTQANNGSDLVLSIVGTTDRITIQRGISGGSDYRVEQVRFDDGSSLSYADLVLLSSGATSGNDTIYGDDLANSMYGGAGDDTFYGRGGNDVLTGGAGNDTLSGDAGDDTYVFNLGDGHDTVSDLSSYYNGWGGNDTIQFGPGIVASDLVITQTNNGNDLLLSIIGTTDQITIRGGIGWGSDYRIEQLRFDDGAILSYDELVAISLTATSGDDVLYGDGQANSLDGGAGNDQLFGRAGNDVLSGGLGYDTLSGNGGDDIYVFSLGDGQDTIRESGVDSWGGNDTIQFGAGISASDILVRQGHSGADLILAIGATQDRVIVQGGITGGSDFHVEQVRFNDGTVLSYTQLVALLDTSVNYNYGANGNDELWGSNQIDIFQGNGGADYLRGAAGSDTYLWKLGDGNDTIDDESGSTSEIDVLKLVDLNASDVTLSRVGEHLNILAIPTGETITVDYQFHNPTQNWGIERIQFADGASWDLATINNKAPVTGGSGNDSLFGWSLDETFKGNGGADYLRGNAGSDTYVWKQGDGNDTIDDQSASTSEIDVLRLADLNAADITLSRGGQHLYLLSNITGATITVDYQFYSQSQNWGIEQIQFADGSSWDLATINRNAWIRGGSGNDNLSGASWDETFLGSAGADYLRGNAGSDTYVWKQGDGNDVIDDESGSTTEIDVLKLLDLNPADVTVSRVGQHVNIVSKITGETITIDYQFYSSTGNWGIERIQFADGTSWDLTTINNNAWTRGGSGNDSLYGSFWGDSIQGGIGNDYLTGGAGSDTYLFNLGDGQDTVDDNGDAGASSDRILFGAGISAQNVQFSRSGTSLVLKIAGTTDQIWISDGVWSALNNPNYAIDRIEYFDFADGTRIALDQVLAGFLIGGSGNDQIQGYAMSDTLEGKAGNDYLTGGLGSDTYVFNLGDGQDTVDDNGDAGASSDRILFGAGISAQNVQFSRSGSSLVVKIAGTTDQIWISDGIWSTINNPNYAIDRIEYFDFADGTRIGLDQVQTWLLTGGAGNDQIQGYTTSDTLQGNAGNDYLSGGLGSDTYVFNLGDGQDTVDDNGDAGASSDRILFGAGISAQNVQFSRSGSSLVVKIAGTTDQIWISDGIWSAINNPSNAIDRVEYFDFADGTRIGLDQVQTGLLTGGAGNDQIQGYTTSDTLQGNAGNDYLSGGLGSDTYVFNLGDGQDTVDDNGDAGASSDRILFGAGVSGQDVKFSSSGNDLLLAIAGTTDSITIRDGLYSAYNNPTAAADQVEYFDFADGSRISFEEVKARLLIGGDGNDQIRGYTTADTIEGGAGNDYLTGGASADNFVFRPGFGKDVITDFQATGAVVDTIQFSSSTFADFASVLLSTTQSGSDAVITVDASNTITLQHTSVTSLTSSSFQFV